MRNWDEKDELGVCHADKEFEEVQRVCDRLNIPCREVNFVKDYWNEVFRFVLIFLVFIMCVVLTASSFLADLQLGLTPNPDVLCNQRIKFNSLLREALRDGSTHLATGHYARLTDFHGATHLRLAADNNKDQTYFMGTVPSTALASCLFPVGDLPKARVKELARAAQLPEVAAKKESMGICFIGKRNFSSFLRGYLREAPGRTVDVHNALVSEHDGVQFYTLGQGACVQGRPQRLVVVGKHVPDNVLVVDTEAGCARSLLAASFLVGRMVWNSSPPPAVWDGAGLACHVRVRHRHSLVPASITHSGGSSSTHPSIDTIGYVPFSPDDMERTWQSLLTCDTFAVQAQHPLRAVTPGQAAAVYVGDVLVGCGTIMAVRPLAQE